MTTAFPADYDAFPTTNPDDDTKLVVPTHSQRLNNFRDAIAAIEARVGKTGETSSLSHDKRITDAEAKVATNHPHGALPDLAGHVAAGDPHTGYRLESADHSHQSTGLQGGQIDHGLAITGLTDDDHTQYLKEEASGGTAVEVPDHTHASGAQAGLLGSQVVAYSNIQNVSATDRILGRDTAGAGVIEEITPAALRTMIDVPLNAEAILKTIVDAQGDLIVGSGADTVARKAVGAPFAVLRSNSAGNDLEYKSLHRILAEVHATTSFSSSTAENTLFSFSVPGNLLQVGDVLRFHAWGRLLTNNTGAATNYVWRMKFGAATPHQTPNVAYADSSLQRAWIIDYSMVVESSTAQRHNILMVGTATGVDGQGWAAFGTGETFLGYQSSAENTATAKTLALTVQMDQSNVNDYVDIRGAFLEYIPV